MPQLDQELEISARPAEPAQAGPPQSGPCVMVIFGATGDLTARKLFPALYNLAKSNLLSREFAIIGVGRSDYTVEQFRQIIGQKLESFATSKLDNDLRDWLLKRIYFVAGEFPDPNLYTRLAQKLEEVDKNHS